jgi:N-acetylglucosamine-6-phosphate deacetylase
VGVRKGAIAAGADADVLVTTRALELQYVFVKGALLKSAPDGWVKKGMFEP